MLETKMGKNLLGNHKGIIKCTKLYLKDLDFSPAFPVAKWPLVNYITFLEFVFLIFSKDELDHMSKWSNSREQIFFSFLS